MYLYLYLKINKVLVLKYTSMYLTPTLTSVAFFVDNLSEQLKTVYSIPRTKMSAASNRWKKNYDHRKNYHSYEKGDTVFLFNSIRKKGVSLKLQSFWAGPFLVIQKLSHLVYEIQVSPYAKPKVVHHDRLKPCYKKLTLRLKEKNAISPECEVECSVKER